MRIGVFLRSMSEVIAEESWISTFDNRTTVRRQKSERKSDDRRTNDDDKRTVKRRNNDDKRTVKRQRGERKSGDRRTNDDDKMTARRQNDDDRRTGRRQNDDDRRTVRRQNDDDKRTVKRQKGEKKSDEKRTEKKLRGGIRKPVGLKFNRIEEFQENKEEMERKLEDAKRQVQREILERIEGLGHQLHRTSIADLGDGSTSPATPLQHSSLMHAESLTPQEMATALVISLRGQALEILQSIPEEQLNNYDRIVGALEIRVDSKGSMSPFKNTKLTSNDLFIWHTLKHLKNFSNKLASSFIDGLPDTEMQQALRRGRHTTISDVMVAALEFKAAKEASRNYKPKPDLGLSQDLTHQTDNRSSDPDLAAQLNEAGEKTKGLRRRRTHSKGIIAPLVQIEDLVPNRQREIRKTTFNVKISVSKISSDERSLIVHGYLYDKWYSFVIDTGATRTILRPDILPKPSKEFPRHVKLETATRELIPVHGELNVKIQLDSKIMYHRVLTADIRDDCILGLDILSKHGFVVDVKNKTIQIQNEEIVMAPKLQDCNKSRRIIVEEDIQIPQGSENIIIAKLDGNGLSTGVVEASERNDGLLVARSLVQINNQMEFGWIANISDQKIILKKNEVIGLCEPVERVVKCEEVNQAQLNQAKVHDPTITESLLTNAAHLEHEETRKARQFLESSYQDVFANGNITGRTSLVQHRIDTGNNPPIKQAPRRLPFAKQNEDDVIVMGKSFDEHLKNLKGIFDEWSSEELKKGQKKDSDLKLIRNWVKNGVRPTWQEVSRYGTTIKGYWAQWSSLCLRDGLLHRKWESPDGKKIRNDLCPNLWKTCERDLNRIHRFASEKLKIHSDKMKQRLDTTSTETAFKPGGAVWFNWEGPYTIIKKINELVYRIQLSTRSKPKVVHLERLARYTGHNPPDWFVVEDPLPRTEDSIIRDE
ncbi:hypothetical protein NQ318_021965 [Aromia moschata]|uniref:Integrase p58-like C-terminal domain-containing protein n=1 Tax=Aromia moschata TaxID=1265417 RepID=A0AAV8XUK9_9CUCU|nr:hypothetical protein NQ318_021965 [Aromia moschata]